MSSSYAVTIPTPVISTINFSLSAKDHYHHLNNPTSNLTLTYPKSLQTRIKALELPEILSLIGQYISQRDALSCVLVSRVWHEAFQPIVWEIVKTGNHISPTDMEKHAHHIKNLSLAELDGLQGVLDKCTRLNTLILWPDSFENEEDEEDDDEEEEEVEEEEEEKKKEESDGEIDISNGSNEAGLQKSSTRVSSLSEQTLEHHPTEVNNQKYGFFDSINQTGEGSSRPGGRELEKLRRDSGFGEESTINLVQGEGRSTMTTVEPKVEFFSIEEAVGSLGFGESNMILPIRSLKPRVTPPKKIQRVQRPPTELASLVLRNPNLTRIEIYCERKSPGGTFWRALSPTENSYSDLTIQYPRLSTFQSICNLQVYKHIKPFLKMCTQLESLDLEQCSLRQVDAEFYSSLNFPRMKELRFARIRDTSLYAQLLIMRQCPKLKSLDWKVPRLGLPVQEFCEALRDSWPDLKILLLPESRLNDAELGEILRSAGEDYSILARGSSSKIPTKGLQRFEARRSDFGEIAFRALKNSGHFETLTVLDLYKCQGLSSWMVAEILQGCPLLTGFDGHQLFARDAISRVESSSNERGGDGQGRWVCRKIRYLDLHFTGFLNSYDQDAQRQRQVFAQIAKLENLRFLSIGGKITGTIADLTGENAEQAPLMPTNAGHGTTVNYTTGLSLKLDYGLDQLEPLKNLEILRFSGVDQKMEEKDVLWMIQNFPRLRIIQGILHTDREKQERLETIFESNNIAVWTIFKTPAPVQRFRQY